MALTLISSAISRRFRHGPAYTTPAKLSEQFLNDFNAYRYQDSGMSLGLWRARKMHAGFRAKYTAKDVTVLTLWSNARSNVIEDVINPIDIPVKTQKIR